MHAIRGGPAHWTRGYAAMLQWELANQRRAFPARFAAQVLVGAGLAVGIGLLRDLPAREAIFLVSGAVVVAAVLHGLFAVPDRKADEFVRSLPVPWSAGAAASLTLTVLIGLPGMTAVLAISAWRYDVAIGPGWEVIPAIGLTAVTAALAGYILGPPRLLAQALLLVVIGFAPVNFPPERLPRWLDLLHDWLPFEPMAVVIRAALTQDAGVDAGRAYLVLTAWLFALVVLAAGRRRR